MSTIKSVPLSALYFGHEYPGANINSRIVGREDDIDKLGASIMAEGLLQALLVCPAPDDANTFYVIDGNRRLAAIQQLHFKDAISATYPVNVIVRDDVSPIDALRKSVLANDHMPLHPVDRFEAFAAVQAEGATPEDIAKRYGTSVRVVKQSLALGKLAPAVRTAWREGDIDAEDAQRFTVNPDHEAQTETLEKLQSRKINTLSIQADLIGKQPEAEELLKFVGLDDFINAGGSVSEDLFGDEDDAEVLVSDYALLKKLAKNKLQARANELEAEGWSWAEVVSRAAAGWKTVTGGARASAENKKKAGCQVMLDTSGSEPIIKVVYGLIKPAAKKEKAAEASSPAQRAKPDTSMPYDARQVIETALKGAAHEQLVERPNLVLAGFCAALFAEEWSKPFNVEIRADVKEEPFKKALARFKGMSQDELVKIIADVALAALELEDVTDDERDDLNLIKELDAATFNAQLLAEFDYKTFFKNVPDGLLALIMPEFATAAEIKAITAKPDKTRNAAAGDIAKAVGWLPAQMRLSTYKAPVVAAAASDAEAKAEVGK